MAGPNDDSEAAAVWRRWRALAGEEDFSGDAAPDERVLAAYADGRLDAARREGVELWLAGHPATLDDILAARDAAAAILPEAPEAMVARAMALVAAPDPRVVPFPRPAARAPMWRATMAWGGMAACLVGTSLVGFSLGNDAYLSLETGHAPSPAAVDLLDPPGTLFPGFGEDLNT